MSDMPTTIHAWEIDNETVPPNGYYATAEVDGSVPYVRADEYLIWSDEHRAWWRPRRSGYTTHISAAGRYSREEALSICRNARGGWIPGEPVPEVPVLLADALACEGAG